MLILCARICMACARLHKDNQNRTTDNYDITRKNEISHWWGGGGGGEVIHTHILYVHSHKRIHVV